MLIYLPEFSFCGLPELRLVYLRVNEVEIVKFTRGRAEERGDGRGQREEFYRNCSRGNWNVSWDCYRVVGQEMELF